MVSGSGLGSGSGSVSSSLYILPVACLHGAPLKLPFMT